MDMLTALMVGGAYIALFIVFMALIALLRDLDNAHAEIERLKKRLDKGGINNVF